MTTTVRPPRPTPTTVPPKQPDVRGASLLSVLLAVVLLCLIAFVGVAPLLSPAVPERAQTDPATQFSLERAQADLAVVAAAPHPLGSAEQAAVEAYLLDELTAMGLDPWLETQTVTMAPDPPHSVWTAPVRTVVARLEGTGPDAEQAVLLAAHHDSVPSSPGAGDNGAGMVSVLEAMRVLAAGPPPRHDVIAAFVDGEEHEMLGSLALLRSAPWLADVRVAVNTEGVGNAGRVVPALTTPDNGWVMRRYLDAVDRPITYSAFTAPLNATGQGADLGRYQEVVPAGLELVIIGGLPAYHAGTDTAAGMHEGTLADYGTAVLALARHLADADLEAVEATDVVAFTVVDGLTVAYSSAWSLPLAVLAGVLVAAALALARRRGRVALRRVALAWLGLGLAGLVGVLAGTALWLLARLVDPRLSDMLNGAVYERTAYILAAVAAGAAGLLVVLRLVRRGCSALELIAGGLLGWSLFALLLAAVLPTAAYAVTWPLLAGTLGFALVTDRRRSPTTTLVIATLAALPAVLLFAPLVVLYFMLAARFELMLPVATPLPMLWVVLGLTLVAPLLLLGAHPARQSAGWAAAVAGAAAVVLLGTGVIVSARSDGPRPDVLAYQFDADTGDARWVALPAEPDDYTGQVAEDGWVDVEVEASPFHQPGVMTVAAAVPAPAPRGERLLTPGATVLSDDTSGGSRQVGLELLAPPGSYALVADIRSTGGVGGITVDGTDVPQAVAGSPSTVRVVAFSPGASTPVAVTVPLGAEVEVALTAHILGLDAAPVDLEPRPASLTTGAYEVTDSVIVTRTVRLAD